MPQQPLAFWSIAAAEMPQQLPSWAAHLLAEGDNGARGVSCYHAALPRHIWIRERALTLLTVAFLYFHGETLNDQTRTVVHRLAGGRVASLIQIAGDTIRAVWYGMLLTATAQGILAGLGFWAVGLAAPVLLGAATAFLALLPFGPPLLWIPAGLWLLIQGTLWKGLALLAWGALAVSGIDNVLRPLFIGGATRIPYLLVLFGVLGGLATFGLLGLFLGPTILSLLLVLWREWASEGHGLRNNG